MKFLIMTIIFLMSVNSAADQTEKISQQFSKEMKTAEQARKGQRFEIEGKRNNEASLTDAFKAALAGSETDHKSQRVKLNLDDRSVESSWIKGKTQTINVQAPIMAEAPVAKEKIERTEEEVLDDTESLKGELSKMAKSTAE